ncbi:MAG: hypothetical protein MZU79_04080 [Anaerotruncus sp.]|nr:hypothetical protein [Anaerotruncus sp.]
MTGTLPPFHGVRDNGGFVVPAELDDHRRVLQGPGLRHRRPSSRPTSSTPNGASTRASTPTTTSST